ncbi:hypothetical protein LMG1873_04607 [Achromobacter piechaudii]|uniref:Uncharacterized protein n=1 Tax=Achromobacter piechaudii TaxID=72556 RepID=A0ABM8L2Q1_9BURK|nr:hypothetical protein LMG1873_04607 [Achromobacter piechaudii]CAB3952646.1 hypothetical protein LMG6103_03511 [Achromobacter piechaudii]
MLMPNTEAPCWRAKLLKRLLLLSVAGLTGCCASLPSGAPKLPQPAADLMLPAPTGSELLGRVSGDMSSWEKMLLDGPTR